MGVKWIYKVRGGEEEKEIPVNVLSINNYEEVMVGLYGGATPSDNVKEMAVHISANHGDSGQALPVIITPEEGNPSEEYPKDCEHWKRACERAAENGWAVIGKPAGYPRIARLGYDQWLSRDRVRGLMEKNCPLFRKRTIGEDKNYPHYDYLIDISDPSWWRE